MPYAIFVSPFQGSKPTANSLSKKTLVFCHLSLDFYYFCRRIRSSYEPSVTKSEKGIRCESGTIPVAVSPTPK